MAKKLYKPILIDTIKAAEDLIQYRFVDFTGSICKTGVKALGVCDVSTESQQYAPVGVLGIFLVEAGDTIAVGNTVTSDNNGKAVPLSNSGSANGIALDSALEGDIIRIVRGI